MLGSLHLLELARRLEARILLTSTSEVYGDPLVHPQPESYRGNVNPTGPRMRRDDGRVVPAFILRALVTVPLPSEDPARRCPDLAMARAHLGWSPQVTLRQGLVKTIEWFAAD